MYKKKGEEAHVRTPTSRPSSTSSPGVLFILALRGLSHPTTSHAGNRYGMIGMAHRRRHDAVLWRPGRRALGSA